MESRTNKVYFTAANTDVLETRVVAAYLQSFEHFRAFDFVPLYFGDGSAYAQVRNISEYPAILLWGQGEEHEYSKDFDPTIPFTKISIDVHQDANTSDWNELCCVPTYYNHLLYTHIREECQQILVLGCDYMRTRGNEYFPRRRFSDWKSESPHGSKKIYVPSKDFAFYATPATITAMKDPLDSIHFFEKPLHITLDLDAVEGFKCDPGFMSPKKIPAQLLYGYIRGLVNPARQNQILRYDLGGLYLSKEATAQLKTDGTFGVHFKEYRPSLEIIRHLVEIFQFGRIVRAKPNRKRFDLILSGLIQEISPPKGLENSVLPVNQSAGPTSVGCQV